MFPNSLSPLDQKGHSLMHHSMNNDLSLSVLIVVFTCLDIAYIGQISVNQYFITSHHWNNQS